jgi:hypothetical protein
MVGQTMKIAHLTVGTLTYYLRPDQVGRIMDDAAQARARGEWFRFDDAGGNHLHLLIPEQSVLALQEYEVDDAPPEADLDDWVSFDFDA